MFDFVVEWISRSGEYTGVYHFMADPTMTKIYQGAIHVYLEKRGGFLARVKYYTNLWKPGPMVSHSCQNGVLSRKFPIVILHCIYLKIDNISGCCLFYLFVYFIFISQKYASG